MTSKPLKMRSSLLPLFVLAAFCLSPAESTRRLHKLQRPEGQSERAHGTASLPTDFKHPFGCIVRLAGPKEKGCAAGVPPRQGGQLPVVLWYVVLRFGLIECFTGILRGVNVA